MLSFLEETIHTIKKEHTSLEDVIFILPSKRACGFLKNYLRKSATITSFAPTIISIEEFIETLSGVQIMDTTELLFKSYEVYLKTKTISEKEDFETYTSWASTLLNDFNEIDRYLLDTTPFFNYLSSIQDNNHWYVQDEKTTLIKNYLNFWNSLPSFYENLKNSFLKERIGHQGLVYREAAGAIEHYAKKQFKQHIFIGFNALNNAEQKIVQELLKVENNTIYWDADSFFFEDNKHAASHFLRKYIKEWPYYKTNKPHFPSNFEKQKKFRFVEVQKNIGQVKYLGELLSKYSNEQLEKTTVVLADETLLLPVLQSLPSNVTQANITMGVTLKTFPTTQFFELFLLQHQNPTNILYYKDVVAVLNHPLIAGILPNADKIISGIASQNKSHCTLKDLHQLAKSNDKDLLNILFGDRKNDSKTALNACSQLLLLFKKHHEKNAHVRVVLFQLFSIFNKIEALNQRFSHLKSIKTIQSLFSELTATTTLDFEGDAYNGLQIMGVLETRVLDFENVIILSVNEDILPSGKTNASFITYDLKQAFDLPSYHEKDAIYTYHFYHLLHRAKDLTFIYNTFSDGLNSGEKSRFLLQLEINKHTNHTIEKIVVVPKVAVHQKAPKIITKTSAVLERLKEIAQKGFSPSALTNYIRNPLDFYYQKVLGVHEFQEVEETVAFNTLGTIVHDTIEAFYRPLEGLYLSSELLVEMNDRIDEEVTFQFKKTYKEGSFSKGKNLIIFEVIKRYISNAIAYDLSEIKLGNQIKILQIEKELDLEISISEIDYPVKIRGKVDRVDQYNGVLRVIDYKTGLVKQNELDVMDWPIITQEYKYSKVVQILAYALMINKEIPISTAQVGIISFKNLNNGFLKFGTKTSIRGSKNQEVSQEILALYLTELKKLILEICNPSIPFTEKEIS